MIKIKRIPPVLAGVLIGISMLAAFVVAGRGIGASGFMTRVAVSVQYEFFPFLTEESDYFAGYVATGSHPLNHWFTYLTAGLLLGSVVSGLFNGSLKLEVLRGDRCSVVSRLLLALLGGIIIGFAARLGRGCTSGQVLVGAAELAVGAWVYALCIFAGGYLAAYLVRKQWI